MSCAQTLSRAAGAMAAGCCLLVGGLRLPATADEMVPESLPPAKKEALKAFLSKLERPAQFLPPGAKILGGPALPSGPEVDLRAAPAAEVKEYLAEVLPHRAADRRKGPDRADLYWFRPNPRKGTPGITVKRVVDLNTGKQVGQTEVLLHYAAPLTREEKEQAIELARAKAPAVRDLYAAAGKGGVEVVALFEQISAAGVPDGTPGDRVVNLQFRKQKAADVLSVNVNVTKETVRAPR
jgi:hypothetical protein